MAPPNEDAARVFTFTAAGPTGGLQVVEAYFCEPDGLFRLRAQATSRASYAPWAALMTRQPQPQMPALPERVVVGPELLARKRWELSLCLHRGRLGPEVDLPLARRLADRSGVIPLHPAAALDLSGGTVRTAAELGRTPHRLRSFFHNGPIVMLRDQWHEYGAGGGRLIRGGDASLMEGAITEWARQWGHDRIAELLLDAACFYQAVGDLDAACTFVHVAAPGDTATREQRIIPFLLGWAEHHFLRMEHRVG